MGKYPARQVEGLDFHETFAPVARMTSQRILIALAAAEGLDLFQVDVKNAYLKGEIVDSRARSEAKAAREPPRGRQVIGRPLARSLTEDSV